MSNNSVGQSPPFDNSPAEGRVLTDLPDAWKIGPIASPWDGMQVHRYHIGEEGEVRDLRFESNLLLCLYRKPHKQVESLNRFGRWQYVDASDGSVAYGPPNAALNYRWGTSLDQTHLVINVDWLQGVTGPGPIPLHGWYAGIHDRVLVQLLEEIAQDALSGTPAGIEHSEWLALSALYRFTALARNTTWECDMTRVDAIMDRALEFIHSGLDTTLRVREIANAAGFESNLYGFVSLFSKYTGLPPHQYVMEARLEQAKNMLLQGNISVTDVALSCGFNNMSHFSTSFKRRWKVRPSELIKRNRFNQEMVVD
ncbi:AraC family transcriptional regulator [Burkholderia sp. MSMB1078WGS]|uniref:helix-turn-helix domain-containing protein n=1 Tax=Burkholderia sp. MSMB1078WGS TaxID=1637900 RepID=UPI0009EAE862|nr:AraC family transcriptional regulator [Burkholderia sp. MSMB1078WGS]